MNYALTIKFCTKLSPNYVVIAAHKLLSSSATLNAADDSDDASKTVEFSAKPSKAPEPPSPDLCCMSGCPKCVFMEYADDLARFCLKTGVSPDDEINKVTKDPNMRMIIKMMLKEQIDKQPE